VGYKYLISEGGLRVPFIVRGPGIPAGATSREAVVGWDLLPTILDMAGAKSEIPVEVEGGSLLELCQSGGKVKVKRHDPFLVFRYTKTHGRRDVAIVQGGCKFLREIDTGKEHFWSLWDDLGEQRNLMSQMPEKADQFRKNLDGYFKEIGWDQNEHHNARAAKAKNRDKNRQKNKKK
jgi:arylsulfatase A